MKKKSDRWIEHLEELLETTTNRRKRRKMPKITKQRKGNLSKETCNKNSEYEDEIAEEKIKIK